jgi:hypothetical protein
MPNQKTHADALREYLSGASSDGGVQTVPDLSLGNYRSATEAVSLGIAIANAIAGVTVLYAGGANPVGTGTLTAVDASHLSWQAPNDTGPGQQVQWLGTSTQILESLAGPGQYLRITATPPFTPGQSQITLSVLYNNEFGFDNVTVAQASAGVIQYRASILRNENSTPVTNIQRWIGQLGTSQVSNGGGLGASGSGTITTSGSFADWPPAGWCQIQDSSNTLKEVVYYSSRTATVLTVPSAGRGLLGTSAVAGTITDLVFAVPGVAIALEPGGAQAFGSAIQTIANQTTAPTGVTWNVGLTPATGLQIGTLGVSQQQGIWIMRQIPAGALATPNILTLFEDSFFSL